MLELIDLLTLDDPVAAPDGIVYSTQPRTAQGADRHQYFIKGTEPEVVFAELAGCVLAGMVGLNVAPVAVCHFNGGLYCGSRKVADIGRNVAPWLAAPSTIRNFHELYAAIVVDVWLANEDRNMGNVLARGVGRGKVDLVMIDFEKSRALRPNPLVASTIVEPRALWPTGELGQIAKERRPICPPPGIVAKISELGREPKNVKEAVQNVVQVFQAVDWVDNSIEALTRRAKNIGKLAGEVWERC